MRFMVAYDISDNHARARVAALVSAWGDRIQQSVFECTMTQEEATSLLEDLTPWVDVEGDSVHLVPICLGCDAGRSLIGQASRPEPDICWVV